MCFLQHSYSSKDHSGIKISITRAGLTVQQEVAPVFYVTQEPGFPGRLLPSRVSLSPWLLRLRLLLPPLSPHLEVGVPRVTGPGAFPDLALALCHLFVSNDRKCCLLITPVCPGPLQRTLDSHTQLRAHHLHLNAQETPD